MDKMSESGSLRGLHLLIISGCVISLMTFGIRSGLGLFTLPISLEYVWDREIYAFALALQNLFWGMMQPLAGGLADRRGVLPVILFGIVIYISGLCLIPFFSSPLWVFLTAGVMIGTGIAFASFGIIMSAFAQILPAERQSWAFGIATASSSLGQFLFAPIGQLFIASFGWKMALIALGLTLLITLPLAFSFKKHRGEQHRSDRQQDSQSSPSTLPIMETLRLALGHRSYILLNFGFFVCGFHVAFITVHLPAYLIEAGQSATVAAWTIALIGLFNIVGSFGSGLLGGHYRESRRILLSLLYLIRAVVITIFLLSPLSIMSSLLFGALMGILWLSTVPLTAGLVTTMFGARYMGMLYGFVFFSHQIGSFSGIWLGGWLYDRTGSYDAMWIAGIALGIFAALVHWPIKEIRAPSFASQSPA